MTVARSDALAAAERSRDDLVADVRARRAQRVERRAGSIRQTCDSPGSRSRSPPIMSSKAAVSAKQAVAPESDRIHSVCSAEEVS